MIIDLWTFSNKEMIRRVKESVVAVLWSLFFFNGNVLGTENACFLFYFLVS